MTNTSLIRNPVERFTFALLLGVVTMLLSSTDATAHSDRQGQNRRPAPAR